MVHYFSDLKMATHLGLGQGLKVLRGDISRSFVHSWRKDLLVDVVMSLALTTGAIPGIREHLEAAHKLALASPSNGGGMDAAMVHLKSAAWRADEPTTPLCEDDRDLAVDNGEVDNSGSGPTAASIAEDETPVLLNKPICRSLWKGRTCEDPTSCDRAHKPLCVKEACKVSRDHTCSDWHYRPKKDKPPTNRSMAASQPRGNDKRGRSAPDKSAKSKSKMRMSHATEKMYFKWKMSEMKSKVTAATYRDILMSHSISAQANKQGQPLNTRGSGNLGQSMPGTASADPPISVPAPQLAGPNSAAACPPPQAVNLAPIVMQLQTIMSALTAAGIIQNQH